MSREKALKLSNSIREFSQPKRRLLAGWHYCPYLPVTPTQPKEVDDAIQMMADEIRKDLDEEIINNMVKWACENVEAPDFPFTNLDKIHKGIPMGQLNVIMGQTNVGKSVFGRNEDAG